MNLNIWGDFQICISVPVTFAGNFLFRRAQNVSLYYIQQCNFIMPYKCLMDILNRENSYVNFSSLIFPAGKLGQGDENMKISKVFQNFKITLYFFILFQIKN